MDDLLGYPVIQSDDLPPIGDIKFGDWSAYMKINVKNCARCGEDHDDLEFTELTRPSDEWTHWAICPTNGQPIMLLIRQHEEMGNAEKPE